VLVGAYTVYMRRTHWVLALVVALLVGGGYYILTHQRAKAPTHATSPTTISSITTDTMSTTLTLHSPAFAHEGVIPSKYTCNGDNVNPPLAIEGIPYDTASLALIVDDPDIPESVAERLGKGEFDHWVVFNIPPTQTRIGEGDAPEGMQGANSADSAQYTGPCPPDGEHRYLFKLFALDTMLDLAEGATKEEVLGAIEGHVLDSTTLMGRYTRQ